ncbi:uncharacterized protein LOC142550854 [Primulina tabacum]|uniref:uncharacterized protein LOC142550854 n=1 Tax=Primulina tabacum TaxID=48773 RepID=UPI003F5989A5
MSDQETILFHEIQQEDTNFEADALNRLHLSTAVHHHHQTTAIPYQTAAEPPESCTTYSNTKKRQFLPPMAFQEPSKRANLHCSCPHAPNAAANNNSSTNPFLGFTALALPLPFPSSPSLPLRRTISEPTHFSGHILTPPLQEGPVINKKEAESSTILRTISDPTPAANLKASNAITPPRPPPSRKVMESLSLGESPDTMRLKRIKERLSEMNQWWNHVMSEEEEDQEDECKNIPKAEPETETDKPQEEAVWVEQNGNCLVLHFKCPCGNGYQVLLNGNNCYYKLTSF